MHQKRRYGNIFDFFEILMMGMVISLISCDSALQAQNDHQLSDNSSKLNVVRKVENLLKDKYVFPESPSVYESLADAYFRNNKKEAAIKMYKIVLDLYPDNRNVAKMNKTIFFLNHNLPIFF